MRWIVGDIHGMAGPLGTLLDAIAQRDADARYYFVGDYVNRGPDSRQAIDRLLALPKGSARFLRGNHDDIFDQILHGRSFAPNASDGNPLVAFRWFLQYGLDATFVSYGADPARLEWLAANAGNVSALDEVIELVPPAHCAFIQALEPVIEDDDLFVAHGHWDVDETDQDIAATLAASSPARRRLLWNRFDTKGITRNKAWRRTGYFGHTPVELYPELLRDPKELLPIQASRIRLLDTAAALVPSGRLTAYCHEQSSFIQADRQGRLLTDHA